MNVPSPKPRPNLLGPGSGSASGSGPGVGALALSISVHGVGILGLALALGFRPQASVGTTAPGRPALEVTLVQAQEFPSDGFADDLPEELLASVAPEFEAFEPVDLDLHEVEQIPEVSSIPAARPANSKPVEPPPLALPANFTRRTGNGRAVVVDADASEVPLVDVPEVAPVPDADPVAEPPSRVGEAAPTEVAGQCPIPGYPRQAERLLWQGTVVVTLDVRADGSVADVRVLTSSGHPVLDDEVLETVARWRFSPGSWAGLHEIEKRFRFDLSGVTAD